MRFSGLITYSPFINLLCMPYFFYFAAIEYVCACFLDFHVFVIFTVFLGLFSLKVTIVIIMNNVQLTSAVDALSSCVKQTRAYSIDSKGNHFIPVIACLISDVRVTSTISPPNDLSPTPLRPPPPPVPDSFLRARATHDHEATAMMKAMFMSLWDGLISDSERCVLVMGATNRPQDVDKAILRRMPAAFPHRQTGMERCQVVGSVLLTSSKTGKYWYHGCQFVYFWGVVGGTPNIFSF